MGSRPRPVSSTGQALRGGMPSRERRFGCSHAFDPSTSSGRPGMGSRRHGNDDSVALAPSTLRQAQEGRGWVPVVTGTTIRCSRAFDPSTSSGGPGMGSRRHGNDDSVALAPSTLRQAQEGRGWVPVVTGTTIRLLSRLRPFDKLRRAGDGFPSSRERRFGCSHAFDPSTSSGGPGMGSRRHGNDDSVALTRSTLRQAQEGRGWVPAPDYSGAGSARERRCGGRAVHFHSNDDSVALTPSTLGQGQEGRGWVPVVTGTTIRLLSRLRPFDKLRRAGDGFPPPTTRGQALRGNDDSVALTPSTLRQAQEGRGWVPVVTGTTIRLLSRLRPFDKLRRAGDGFPSSRERRFGCSHAFDPSTSSGGPGMGSRPRLLGGRLCAGTTVWGACGSFS